MRVREIVRLCQRNFMPVREIVRLCQKNFMPVRDMEYELLELWRTTGRSGVQIAHLYLDAIDRFQEKLEILSKKESFGKIIDIMVSVVYHVTEFADYSQNLLTSRTLVASPQNVLTRHSIY